uniref:Uncharacterized protein n=1 Tax=Rhizophora mucronata TaxID=61149 RepID=A0A2P2KN24_RHIMU
MSTTVYSEKLDTKRKWCITSPLRSLNLLVSSLGIQGETLKGSFEQRLLFFDKQSSQSLQSAIKVGITISPSFSSSASSPTLSTTPIASWPRILGKIAGNSFSFQKVMSLWQRDVQIIRTRTS